MPANNLQSPRAWPAPTANAAGRHYLIGERHFRIGNGYEIVALKKQIPSDVNAQRMWPHNRQPDRRDKQVRQVDVTVIPQEKLDEIHRRNIEKQREMMAPVLGRAQRLGIAGFVQVGARRGAGGWRGTLSGEADNYAAHFETGSWPVFCA